ncbi:MAG: hypothetical protein AAF651_09260 [Cyanobacteria bacterium P01_C01_bin.73]
MCSPILWNWYNPTKTEDDSLESQRFLLMGFVPQPILRRGAIALGSNLVFITSYPLWLEVLTSSHVDSLIQILISKTLVGKRYCDDNPIFFSKSFIAVEWHQPVTGVYLHHPGTAGELFGPLGFLQRDGIADGVVGHRSIAFGVNRSLADTWAEQADVVCQYLCPSGLRAIPIRLLIKVPDAQSTSQGIKPLG